MLPVYKPSGHYSPVTFLFVPAAAVIAAGAAWLYVLLLAWIPFIVLNFMLTLGFAFVLAVITRFALRTGKCRNTKVGALLGLLIGLAGLIAAHYWAYAAAVSVAPGPVAFLDYVQWRASTGWQIGGRAGSSSSGGGIPVTGVFFYAIWMIEAAILLIGGWLGGVDGATVPFCEDCGLWADRKSAEFSVPGLSDQSLQRLAGATEIDTLLTPALSEVSPSPSEVVYTINSCPGCSSTAFATLTHRLTIPPAKGKGKPEVKTTAMLTKVPLDQAQSEAVLALKSDVDQALAMGQPTPPP